MDWNSTDLDGSRVQLAITKLPAKVAVSDPRYGGLLWLQIGGPGSSGVSFALNHAKTVQMIVDSSLDPLDQNYDRINPPKYYDILGMDPRGVNNTRPSFTCFPDAMSRDLWGLRSEAEGIMWSSDSAFINLWARNKALSAGCTARAKESGDDSAKLAFYMNTSPLIADMVHVIEEHGRWREEEALRTFTSPEPALSELWTEELLATRDRTNWKRGEEKLLYWGLSYGTVVGATFAAMQPHRIERAIIDGVVDAPDYYRGEWSTNLDDTDLLLDKFSEYCYQAGPDKCSCYAPEGSDSIKIRFYQTVEFLKGDPIVVPASGVLAPDIITFSDMKYLILQAVYSPFQFWPTLAQILSDLSHHNGTSFAALKQESFPITTPNPECLNSPPYTPGCTIPPNTTPPETTVAILCSDGNSTLNMSFPTYAEYAWRLHNQSWLIGDSWAHIRMSCIAWGITPAWRFSGPIAAQTAKPMLLLGNTIDPVTPLRNAYALAERFTGSRVLATEGEGHCMLSAPSLCAALLVRRYFQSGELPGVGVGCGVNEQAFLGVGDWGGVGEEELLESLRWSARHFMHV